MTDASLIVQRWLAHVPPTQVHVVTVPPRGADPKILLGRFAAALGIDTSAWSTDDRVTNQSLDRVQVELLRRLNPSSSASLDRRAQRRLVQGALLPRMRSADPRRRMRIPAGERVWVDAETSRRIEALRGSGAFVHGDLADLDAAADMWEDALPQVSDGDLLDEALQLLVSTNPDAQPDRLDIL